MLTTDVTSSRLLHRMPTNATHSTATPHKGDAHHRNRIPSTPARIKDAPGLQLLVGSTWIDAPVRPGEFMVIVSEHMIHVCVHSDASVAITTYIFYCHRRWDVTLPLPMVLLLVSDVCVCAHACTLSYTNLSEVK
jgi:hypothetical protein